MNSSGNNENFEGSNSRPFFYVPPMAQQPHLGLWYQNPAYNPLSISGAAFTNGSLYFPMVLSEYPAFLVPQSPLPTTVNRRSIVPMLCNTAQFRQYGGYWEKMKTKDTQTEAEPQPAENLNEKQDVPSEGDGPEMGKVTSIPASTSNETMPSYDVVYGKDMPQKEMLQNGISQSFCESRGMLFNSYEGRDRMSLDETEKRYAALSPNPPPLNDRDEIQNTQNSKLYQSIGDMNKLHQERALCASMEAVKDLSLHSESSQKPFTAGESMPENSSGSHGSPEAVGEEVESNSCPEMAIPPPPCLAQVSKVDEGIQCDLTWWTEVQSGNSPGSSPGSGRKGAEQMSVGSRNQDEVYEVENNGCGGRVPSPAWLAQVHKVDEGIQCNVSCSEVQVEKFPQQIPSRGEETASDSETKGSWKQQITNRKLSADKEEMIMNDETGEVSNENLKRCAKIKKTVKGRKLKELSSFSNVKTAYLLKKSAVLTIVLPEDSEDSELEEEGDMDEVECLLEVSPQSPLTSSRRRSYHKAGRIIRMSPESSLPPQLMVWPTRNKCKLLHAYGECECVPAVYRWRRQDGCESTGVGLRSRPAMAKQEGLQSQRASYRSLECK
ncbi:unnamed protein product [Rangifer tarandus platyrhynchus]|uniref:Uncharacterized protein n=2 Tax=Rangifer tarandus platyrhynchus TaxID=3082113 RepID=A0ABN8YFQ5_RANTA|nr:unnamed protein product [Rangifer tarandus platyrhynchus]CAI9699254.1 unnamed protein product [Rangifer tarandus platyrhynchus]